MVHATVVSVKDLSMLLEAACLASQGEAAPPAGGGTPVGLVVTVER